MQGKDGAVQHMLDHKWISMEAIPAGWHWKVYIIVTSSFQVDVSRNVQSSKRYATGLQYFWQKSHDPEVAIEKEKDLIVAWAYL